MVSGAALALACKIALVPGAFATQGGGAARFVTAEDYFAGYARFFARQGCEVKKIEFPPDGTIEERALVLRDQVERFASGGVERFASAGKVVLIAHSQGGLDARFALKKLGLVHAVSSLVTIGAPHRGSPAAVWADRHRRDETALYWLLRTVGSYDLRELRFLGELTPEFLAKNAEHFAAVPGLRYASALGVCREGCHRGLRLFSWWTGVGPGDGLVPRESQVFGEVLGEFDLDHLSEVGLGPEKEDERSRLLGAVWKWLLADDNVMR